MKINPQLLALTTPAVKYAESGKNIEKSSDAIDSFGDVFNKALNQVNDLQVQAQDTSNKFAAGEIEDIHQVMIASEKADLALQFTIQVRNKLLDAYHEIMRMQV